METGQHGNRGEEEDESRARAPGVDVELCTRGWYLPATCDNTQDTPAPRHGRRTTRHCGCLLELRFARMQYKPRIYHFVRMSERVPSSSLDTASTHDRPHHLWNSALCGERTPSRPPGPRIFTPRSVRGMFAGPCQHFLMLRARMTSSNAH